MARILILITAATFFFYGIWFMSDPSGAMYFLIQENLQTSSGHIDLRATYGGMSIGVGLVLFALGFRDQTIRLGLISVLFLMIGMALGRTIGIAIDGSPNNLMLTYLGLELGAGAIALYLLSSQRE